MSGEHSNVIYLNQAQLKKPCLWSYVLRDPANNIVVRGEGNTRNACQRQAMLQVSDHAEKLSILQAIVRCSPYDQGWSFVVTPPSARPGAHQRPKPYRPTWPQIAVLMLGLSHKLSRYSMGWCCDEDLQDGDIVRMFSVPTVNALWNRELLDANCPDPTIPYKDDCNTNELDGTSRLQVWTSDLGIQTLQNEGMLVLREQ